MTIAQEMKLKEELSSVREEALLGLLRTAGVVLKLGERFFAPFGITIPQYNILVILRDQEAGLSQVEISERQLVDRSNMTGLIDRLEKRGLVKRTDHPRDRRTYLVKLTPKGRDLVARAREPYHQEVERLMGCLTSAEARAMAAGLEKLRSTLGPQA